MKEAPLRSVTQLIERGLAPAEQRAELEQVAQRYAVTVPPALAVLLKLVHVCAVYCRFCFRREMVGPGKPTMLSKDALANALDYIGAHKEIWEVILTGGDPLVLSPRRLREVMKALAAIEHVKVIRIHTRVPVADPDRISPELVRSLKVKGKAVYVAVHVNH